MKIQLILLASILLLTFSFGYAQTGQKNNFYFNGRILDALEKIENAYERERIQYLREAASILMSAQHSASSPEVKEQILEIVQRIAQKDNFEQARHEKGMFISQIRSLISKNRIAAPLDLDGEQKLLQNLVTAYLFPTMNPKEVGLEFHSDNHPWFTTRHGLLAIASFISDPRLLEHDDVIHQLVTGKTLEGKDPDFIIEAFVKTPLRLSDGQMDSPHSTGRAIINAFNKVMEQFERLNNGELPENLPIQLDYEYSGSQFWIKWEGKTLESLPWIQRLHTALALLAEESTTLKYLLMLEELSIEMVSWSAPMDLSIFKVPMAASKETVNLVKAALERKRNWALWIQDQVKGVKLVESAEELRTRFLNKIDKKIVNYEALLEKYAKPMAAESAVAPSALEARGIRPEAIAMDIQEGIGGFEAAQSRPLPRPLIGAEGSGEIATESVKERYTRILNQLKADRKRLLEQMNQALTNLREGGLEVKAKFENGKWVHSRQVKVLSPAELESYTAQQLAETKAGLASSEQKLATYLENQLHKLEQMELAEKTKIEQLFADKLRTMEEGKNADKARLIHAEKERALTKLQERYAKIRERLQTLGKGQGVIKDSIEKLKKVNLELPGFNVAEVTDSLAKLKEEIVRLGQELKKKYDYIKAIRLCDIKIYFQTLKFQLARFQFVQLSSLKISSLAKMVGTLKSKIQSLSFALENVYNFAHTRAQNLRNLTALAKKAREAMVVSRASGPFWSRHSVVAWNADKGLFVISTLLSAYQGFLWWNARSRAKTDDERYELWREYYPKVVAPLLYLLPGVQYGAFAVDVIYLLYASLIAHEPDTFVGTEKLIRETIYQLERVVFWSYDLSHWDIHKMEMDKLFPTAHLSKNKDHWSTYYTSDLKRNLTYLSNEIYIFRRETLNNDLVLVPKPTQTDEDPESDLLSKSSELKKEFLIQQRHKTLSDYQRDLYQYIGLVQLHNHAARETFSQDIFEWERQISEQVFWKNGLVENLTGQLKQVEIELEALAQ